MHPLIAFLAFIFSPSDNWLLRQSYQLALDPAQFPAMVQQYEDITRQYPTTVGTGEKAVSADAIATSLWAELLNQANYPRDAEKLWRRLNDASDTPAPVRERAEFRLGETALAQGDVEKARQRLTPLALGESPYSTNALADLLAVDLIAGDKTSAVQHTQALLKILENGPLPHRAYYPLGLAAYAAGDDEKAIAWLGEMKEDPRAQYFRGLALRRSGKASAALAQWQDLSNQNVDGSWRALTQLQIAETYFAEGDVALSQSACQTALARNPTEQTRAALDFRVASIDLQQKHYPEALARLQKLKDDPALGARSNELSVIAWTHLGNEKDLYDSFVRRQHHAPATARDAYERAWASLYHHKPNDAIAFAENGFEHFSDRDYTPRALLLQGLAFEHAGQTADALAAYQTVQDRFPSSLAAPRAIHWTTLALARNHRDKEIVTDVTQAWSKMSDEQKKSAPDVEFWIADSHRRLNRFDDAQTHYAFFLNTASGDHALRPNATFERAAALHRLGRQDESLALLAAFQDDAKKAGRADWVALASLQRGHLYFNNKQYTEAIAAYRSAPPSPRALFYEGASLARLDYYTDAIDKWTALASTFPADGLAPQALFRVARTQFDIGLASAAATTFIALADTYPDNSLAKSARLQAAHAYYNSGQFAAAAPLYAAYLKRYPLTEDEAVVTPYLAGCYAQMGKNETEMAELLKGLPPTPALASVRWATGADHYNHQQYAEADASFAALLSEMPADENALPALFYRGESAYQRKDWKETAWTHAAYVARYEAPADDQRAVALFHKGVALFNTDRLLAAADAFQAVLDQFPNSPLANDARENMLMCHHNLGNWDKEEQLREQHPSAVTNVTAIVAQAPAATEEGPNRSVVEITPELKPKDNGPTTDAVVGQASLPPSNP